MTTAQLFIVGYVAVGVIAFLCGRLSRAAEISLLKAATIALVDSNIALANQLSRLKNPPREKNGRFCK